MFVNLGWSKLSAHVQESLSTPMTQLLYGSTFKLKNPQIWVCSLERKSQNIVKYIPGLTHKSLIILSKNLRNLHLCLCPNDSKEMDKDVKYELHSQLNEFCSESLLGPKGSSTWTICRVTQVRVVSPTKPILFWVSPGSKRQQYMNNFQSNTSKSCIPNQTNFVFSPSWVQKAAIHEQFSK